MMKGWSDVEFFIEAGVSGSVPLADRLEGHRLLADLRAGDVIISAKLDRAFRSAADALGTLEQLKEDKVALHLIDLGGDVTGNGISKMVFTILAAVAEGERDRIRERIRDAKRHLTAQGVFSGGKRPFGTDIVRFDSVGCDGCCLKRLIPRRSPRKTDPIGIRPVLLPAWKRQGFRDRCHDRSALQSSNVCRQRENA
jgi:Resolvase, N terminal domain